MWPPNKAMKRQMPYRMPGGKKTSQGGVTTPPQPSSPPAHLRSTLRVTHADVGVVVGLHGVEEAALREHRDVALLQGVEGRDQIPEDVAGVARPVDADAHHHRRCGDEALGVGATRRPAPRSPRGRCSPLATISPWSWLRIRSRSQKRL